MAFAVATKTAGRPERQAPVFRFAHPDDRLSQRSSDVTVARPGILAIFNNVAPGREAEFEEWFQHEHLQERLRVPGFVRGRRYEAVRGDRRYFNFYVTRSADVLNSADYRMRLNNPTPMTRLVM